ncbi:hypothetical protein [Paenibacillus sp. GCM10027626]|uniref:hypothetical protein n=1 Tax=Paenibacillus sp. GCM10027626 TaxID=3273411 RepID=UPI0036357A96
MSNPDGHRNRPYEGISEKVEEVNSPETGLIENPDLAEDGERLSSPITGTRPCPARKRIRKKRCFRRPVKKLKTPAARKRLKKRTALKRKRRTARPRSTSGSLKGRRRDRCGLCSRSHASINNRRS